MENVTLDYSVSFTTTKICEAFDASTLGWLPSRRSFDIALLVVNLVGILSNLALFLVLLRNSLGSKLATMFFMHQSFLDATVCFNSAMIIFQPPFWRSGSDIFDSFMCRLWHSQFLFWFFVQLSIGNLVLVGLERYWAVVHPIYYTKLSPKRQGILCFVCNVIYNVVLALPTAWETKFMYPCGQPRCKGQGFDQFLNRMFAGYSITWFILIYILALNLFIFFYGKVILQLKRARKLQAQSSTSLDRKKEKAAMQFTKMAIIITCVYVIFISYDAFAYMFGRTGVWVYTYGTLPHQMGTFVVSMNSFANPVIYFFIVMRKSFLRKLCPQRYVKNSR